jgi:hypothetical protein
MSSTKVSEEGLESQITHTLSVKVPPMIGPSTDEMPNVMANMELKIGRLRSGTSGSIIIMHPEKIPAEPRPAMARPIMKVTELGAAPQIAEPTSNTTVQRRKTHFVEYS